MAYRPARTRPRSLQGGTKSCLAWSASSSPPFGPLALRTRTEHGAALWSLPVTWQRASHSQKSKGPGSSPAPTLPKPNKGLMGAFLGSASMATSEALISFEPGLGRVLVSTAVERSPVRMWRFGANGPLVVLAMNNSWISLSVLEILFSVTSRPASRMATMGSTCSS